MDFTKQKEQVLSLIEKGDIQEIVNESGLSRQTIQTAHRKCCLSEMSGGERRAWEATLNYLSNKQKKVERLEKETAKLSERI